MIPRFLRPALLAALTVLGAHAEESSPLTPRTDELQAAAEGGDLQAAQQLYMRHAFEGHQEQAREWAAHYIKLLTHAAESGDTRAMLRLGACYLTGADYTPVSIEQAVTWFSRASEAGEPAGAYMMAEVFAKQGNAATAAEAYRRAYELYTARTDTEALYWMGFMELNGLGTPARPAEGIEKLVHASEQGSAWADAQLFKAYYTGTHAPKDEAKALVYARKLADERHDGAMAYVVATALITGHGLPKDEALGERYLDQAAAANIPDAIFMKAQRLEQSHRLAEAMPLYKQAASMLQSDALVRLGSLLVHGADGVEQDTSRGLAMLEQAAERFESPLGAWELACYYRSVGADASADSWYATAAQRGVAEAMARRGVLHLIPGSGVAWSPTEAYRWWRVGKAAGDPTCSLYLNLFHFVFTPLLLILTFGLPAFFAHRILKKRA